MTSQNTIRKNERLTSTLNTSIQSGKCTILSRVTMPTSKRHPNAHRHTMQCNQNTISYNTCALKRLSTTASILPSRPPPLLPLRTIKLLLPQLPVNLVVRLTHPLPKLVPTLRPHPTLHHKLLEILGTHPARI